MTRPSWMPSPDPAGPGQESVWDYPRPPRLEPVARRIRMVLGGVAFYAGRMDACLVGDEIVVAQPGGFYGGWVTRDVVGPFKGEPGTMGW